MKSSQVFNLNPMQPDNNGAHWNPLEEIRVFSKFDASDAQNIFLFFMKSLPWYKDYSTEQRITIYFLTALALHLRYTQPDSKNGNASLSDMFTFLTDPAWDSDKQMYTEMIDAIHDPEGKMNWKDSFGKPTKTHPMIAGAAAVMRRNDDYKNNSILEQSRVALSLYSDPLIAMNTANSDFVMRDISTSTNKTKVIYALDKTHAARLQQFTDLCRLYSESLQVDLHIWSY